MLLHKDKNLFEQTIFQVVQRNGIECGIIEKDYYVSFLLKELIVVYNPLIAELKVNFRKLRDLSRCRI